MPELKIRSCEQLASLLGTPVGDLRHMAQNPDRFYTVGSIKKIDGNYREICKPRPHLRKFQRGIHELLVSIPVPSGLHGSVRRRSALTNAISHQKRSHLMRLDVQDYFGSITHKQVWRLFAEQLHFPPDVCSLITKLTTYRGSIPQGAPSSSTIANLIAATSWYPEIKSLAKAAGFRCTVYVDDITISGDKPPKLLLPEVRAILASYGYRLAPNKTHLMPRSTTQQVTGYVVNDGVRKSREWKMTLRTQVHRLATVISPDNHEQLQHDMEVLLGKIAHLKQVEPEYANRLEIKLRAAVRSHLKYRGDQ